MLNIEAGRYSPIKAKDQFACHDGSKCVDWKASYCDGRKHCPDGSDEVCECQGKTDCKDRIQKTFVCNSGDKITPMSEDCDGTSVVETTYICKSGDEIVLMSKYCDGHADCADESDEEGCADCPGLTRCHNKHFTCANIPCNNTGPDKPDWKADLTCEANFRRGKWGLCEEKGKEARCVKVR